MKTPIKIQFFALAIVALFAARTFAASDYLLEIEGVKGEATGKKFKMTEQPDGSWLAQNVPAGTYKICYTVNNVTWTEQTRSTGKSSSQNVRFDFEVSMPRDAQSGMATGKRMHKPFVITKELDKMSPRTTLGEILVGDLDGDGSVDKTTGDPVHGVDVKLGATPTSSSDKTPGDPIPGLDVKPAAKGSPVKAGYDVVAVKKV
jgi:hypothetical protein